MAELYGWAGRILRVNLSTGMISNVDTTKYVPKYIGGRGVADRIAWEEVPFENGVGPFDEENKIIFMVGPLSGTLAPSNGKTFAATISPRSYPVPLFTRSVLGGIFGPELKYAGYDGIIVEGKAEKPVYLWINDGVVELKDAEDLWGNGTYATQMKLKNIHGKDAQVMCIGQAGENLVRIATIQHGASHSMGQVGFGAVMGSKNLKAIAVRGTGSVKVPDPEAFFDLWKEIRPQCAQGWWTVWDAEPITDPAKRVKRHGGSPSCTFACSAPCGGGYYKDLSRTFGAGIATGTPLCNERQWYGSPDNADKVRYEGDDIKVFRNPGWDDATANELREHNADLGICTWNLRTFAPYIINCVKSGIDSLQGYPLDYKSAKWWYDFWTDIAYRRGLGDVFAEGLRRAADILGVEKDTAEFMEFAWGQPAHRDSRQNDSHPDPGYFVMALQWAMDSRDPYNSHHCYSLVQGYINKYNDGEEPRMKDAALTLYGNEKAFDRGDYEGKAEAAVFSTKRSCVKDSLFLCDWIFPRLLRVFKTQEEFDAAADISGDTTMEVRLFNAATGLNWSEDELDYAGQRIETIERAIHAIQGRTRAWDEGVIPHFEYPDRIDGTRLDAAKFRGTMDKYYEAMGWDKATGWPTRATLEEMGLNDVADKLASLGKLP